MIITKHMRKRMQQRGRNFQDIKLIERFGTKLSQDTLIMRKEDRAVAADTLKSELPPNQHKPLIQRLDHLVGFRFIHNEDIAITVYSRRKKLARVRNKYYKHLTKRAK